MSKIRYNEEADQALENLYVAANNAVETADKIRALEKALQENSNYYAFGGVMTDDMKLGCLEYEYLSSKGLIELVLA
jgi:hypothetical protein